MDQLLTTDSGTTSSERDKQCLYIDKSGSYAQKLLGLLGVDCIEQIVDALYLIEPQLLRNILQSVQDYNLTKREHAQFYINYIFGRSREPNQSQKYILRQWYQNNKKHHLNDRLISLWLSEDQDDNLKSFEVIIRKIQKLFQKEMCDIHQLKILIQGINKQYELLWKIAIRQNKIEDLVHVNNIEMLVFGWYRCREVRRYVWEEIAMSTDNQIKNNLISQILQRNTSQSQSTQQLICIQSSLFDILDMLPVQQSYKYSNISKLQPSQLKILSAFISKMSLIQTIQFQNQYQHERQKQIVMINFEYIKANSAEADQMLDYIIEQVDTSYKNIHLNSYAEVGQVFLQFIRITNILYSISNDQLQLHHSPYSFKQKLQKLIKSNIVNILRCILIYSHENQALLSNDMRWLLRRLKIILSCLYDSPQSFQQIQDFYNKQIIQLNLMHVVLAILIPHLLGPLTLSKLNQQFLQNKLASTFINNHELYIILLYILKTQQDCKYNDNFYVYINQNYAKCHPEWHMNLPKNRYQHPILHSPNKSAPAHFYLWKVFNILRYIYNKQKLNEQCDQLINYNMQLVLDINFLLIIRQYLPAQLIVSNKYVKQFIVERCKTVNKLYYRLLRFQQPLNLLEYITGNNILYSLSHQQIILNFQQHFSYNSGLQPITHSNFYRNHWNMYIHDNILDLVLQLRRQNNSNIQSANIQLYQEIIQLIEFIKEEQPKIMINNSTLFFQVYYAWRYILLLLQYFNAQNNQYQSIVEQIITIMKLGNIHPLMRQHISIILGSIYLYRFDFQIKNKYRHIFIKLLFSNQNDTHVLIDLNKQVPILIILGYEMIETNQQAIFDIFVRFIACHHAYVRSIAQYYISKFIQTNSEAYQHTFMTHLCRNVWKKDKDCVKIMKNICIVVQGFKQAIENYRQVQFYQFERVQEKPHKIVAAQLHKQLQFFLKNIKQQIQSKEFRAQNGQQVSTRIAFKQLGFIVKKKLHKMQIFLTQYKNIPSLQLRFKDPDIIIIASLLQKVHNFGHLLRTLHSVPHFKSKSPKTLYKNIMVIVPSKNPFEHLQCQELIPQNSQIHLVQVKQFELISFIKLFQKMGYPLIGLEQCAGSIKLQQFGFPEKYMLLLGNQRVGAPACLLNQANYLVQIPQIGKVRSLNVHVSMVICLWQSIIKSTHN